MKNAYSDVIGKDMTLDTGHTYLDPMSTTCTCATSVILKSNLFKDSIHHPCRISPFKIKYMTYRLLGFHLGFLSSPHFG